jgi:autotransporter-associated beta strand protein
VAALVIGDGVGPTRFAPQVQSDWRAGHRQRLRHAQRQQPGQSLQAPLTLKGGLVQTWSAGFLAAEDVIAITGGGLASLISGNLIGLVEGQINFNVQDGADLIVTAAIGNFGGSVVKNGPGRLQLAAASINTGPTTINAGTVRITNATALGPAGSAHRGEERPPWTWSECSTSRRPLSWPAPC